MLMLAGSLSPIMVDKACAGCIMHHDVAASGMFFTCKWCCVTFLLLFVCDHQDVHAFSIGPFACH